MKYLTLVDINKINELNTLYGSTEVELTNRFLKEKIIDLRESLDRLDPNDYTDIDYRILKLK